MNNLFNVNGTLWLEKDEKSFIGKGRVELLQNIQIYGSISKASKAMKMSYKAAWDSVDIMNKLSNKPLVIKVSGGKGGGGTVITSHAKEIIEAYFEIEQLHQNYLKTLANSFNDNIVNEEINEPIFSRLNGKIIEIKDIDKNCEVTILLNNSQQLTSIESKRFINEKNLCINDEVKLLIESNNITLSNKPIQNSARNILKGKIKKVHDDGLNVNILIDCMQKEFLNAKITQSSFKSLQLKMEQEVYAQFKAYNITII